MTRRTFTLAAMLVSLPFSAIGLAGPKVYVGANVAPAQQVSMDRIDHSRWNALLHKYVDRDGMVNYKAWKSSGKDVRELDLYLASLSYASPSQRAGGPATLSFWINAYNAVTVKGILKEYPTTSIRNHTARFYGYNIWHDLLLNVGGKGYSLDQIEHKILRKAGEPRIHFAIVCASISCPRLLAQAYTADKLEKQLVENTRDFFARPGNFRYDQQRQRFHLSEILDWFGEDFGASTAAQLRAIGPYLPSQAARDAARSGKVSVSHLDYDWGLNEQGR